MIRYLHTFLVAAETSSFSKAGAALGLTQSAVSLQIRRLEEDLGCVLFDRTGKSVSLSAEGRRVLVDAARIVDLYQGLQGQSRPDPGPAAMNVGAISTVQSTLLPRALHRFWRQFPTMHINIVPGMSVQLLSQVDSHELELAIMIKPRVGIPEELRWLPLMRERYVGVAPAGAPQDLKRLLTALPFIRYNRHSHGGQLVDRFLKQQSLWVREGLELDEPAVILKMISEGLGWAIIPGKLVEVATQAKVQEFKLPGRPFFREIGVLAHVAALRHPSTLSLIAALREDAQAMQEKR